jgi:hypothetical protein
MFLQLKSKIRSCQKLQKNAIIVDKLGVEESEVVTELTSQTTWVPIH